MYTININHLQNLNHSYYYDKSSLHFIYGKNKSGKTSLLRDFVTKKNYIYFQCTSTSKAILYPRLAHIISIKFKQKNSLNFFKKFEDLLELIAKEPLSEKLLIIFDDFHELLKIDKNALNIIFEYWNKELKHKNLQFIITSNSSFDNTYDNKLKKYSKNTFFMENIPFKNINNIRNISPLDQLYIYSFFGTSDEFLKYYNPKLEFIKNVYNISLQINSPFLNYGFDYLKKDIADISTYCSILYSISKGHNKIGDIAAFINLKSTDLSRYIKKLQDLFIITKLLPIGDNFKNSKYGRYYINDKFLHFWFCYIFNNISLLQMKKFPRVLKEIDNTFLKDIVEPSYKDFILNLLKKDSLKYLSFTPLNIGKWWDNTDEIDIVAYDNEQISFITVMWADADSSKLDYNKLKVTSDKYKTYLKKNYIVISKNTYVNYMKEEYE